MSNRLSAYCRRPRESLKRLACNEASLLRRAGILRHAIQVYVEEGQRYETVFTFLGRNNLFNIRGRPPVWEVQSVSTRFLALPHARLVNQEDPCDIRMVSCATITEGRTFKLVGQSERRQQPQAEAA